ncbi:MAG: hypothetical protein EBZ78_02235 [Verrucomicrobia bacterium]|nr:hypothetical protein [Verrucomicrobiota bacterium]
MQVKLSVNEVLVAGYVGMRRNAEASYKHREMRFPERNVGELWGNHIESAHAELVVSKALGIYWGFGVNTFHNPDIADTNLEVRWSSRDDVKIRPDDSGIIVSVKGRCPDYEIMGWIYASEGQAEQFKYSKEPVCYFVPHKHLRPFHSLEALLEKKKQERLNMEGK